MLCHCKRGSLNFHRCKLSWIAFNLRIPQILNPMRIKAHTVYSGLYGDHSRDQVKATGGPYTEVVQYH